MEAKLKYSKQHLIILQGTVQYIHLRYAEIIRPHDR